MSIAPSFCSAVSRSIKNCFKQRTKLSGPKVHEVVSPSRLSPEMEARVQGLPFMWRVKCRKILGSQSSEVQREQILVWEQLPDFTKTSTWPPASTIFKELVPVNLSMPMPTVVVVEPEVNLDFCRNWFADDVYDDEDEEEEEEEFEDDASLRWLPRELVVPQTDHLPSRFCQVAVHSVVVENAPVITEFSALPSPHSPPSSPIPSPHIFKPLQRATRTKGRNGIPRDSARSAIPLPVLLRPSHARQTKKTANRPTSYSGRWLSSTQEKLATKPLGNGDVRKREDISYDDFAKDLDKRRKSLNGTSALGHLPISVHPSRPASTQRKVVGRSTRPTRRSTSSKENWQQVEAAPLRKHMPTTLGAVSPRVEDVGFNWCHLAVDISYGTFANGLDERRMIIDDAFVTQDWDY